MSSYLHLSLLELYALLSPYILYFRVILNISINCCIHFSFFYQFICKTNKGICKEQYKNVDNE